MSGRSVLQSLMSGSYYIGYYPSLGHALGSPSAAIFLAKIAEWEPYSQDGWVFRKQDDLYMETCLTSKMQLSCRRKLVDIGVMEENNDFPHGLLHYKIKWDRLEELLLEWEAENSPPQISQTENVHSPTGVRTLAKGRMSYNNVTEQRKEKEKVTNVTQKKKVQPVTEKLTDEVATDRWEALVENHENGALLKDLAQIMAEQNATGKVSIKRLWKELGARYLDAEERFPDIATEAWAYGLERAVDNAAPNINYAKRAAESYDSKQKRNPKARRRMKGHNIKDGWDFD